MTSFITTVLVSHTLLIVPFTEPWTVNQVTLHNTSGDVLMIGNQSGFFHICHALYMYSCLHEGNDSNQRTRNQFRPRNATKGTTSYQLRQYAEATLGGGSLRKIVRLPEGEDENEWLAVNSKVISPTLRLLG